MRLEVGNIFIKDIQFGDSTKVENGVLYVNKQELISELSSDEHIKSIDMEIVRPGESVRIAPVKDVIEPRVKVEGNGGIFPGFLSKVDTVGEGKTNVLKGAAVVTTGKVVGFQEGIIDMTGPGADYTPFSKTCNVVIIAEPVDGLKQHDHEAALRMVGLKAGKYLGEAGRNITPDEVKVYETKPIFESVKEYPNLPKVAYVYMLQTQGLLHDTYVYGVDAKKIIPTLIYPTEVMDGAILSGNCVSACDKNPTYVHMNNPVIHDLYELHGKEYNFVGVIITNENVYLADKERSSNWTAKMAEYLGLDGVIISEEGFGNPDTDLIMNCKKITKKGIKTVILTDEYAGRDGASQSLADADAAADACVTGGNANMTIVLPKLDKIIGHVSKDVIDVIAGGFDGSLRADGSIEVEIQAITGATSEVGFNKMTAKTY
ncbi:Glycine reductase component B, subunits alpha and beta (Selenoprotein PB alpha/beta) [Contains: Betaine reductase component B subunit beta; Betaine reductase component B subunit alpha] [Acetoanaerobium sticklandii]|uniref:Glycine reductase complex component B subunits alpha and beta n=1 Tax=Acetoanaerobium sticklandii (strain ATCC 12662 / DSM 519 / JCM 1433 / CCUG 9281 / NCIMB 10654 / HF) TaxID=499177 RepID=GRDE_ACESD|nr:glycine/sarcosine/betaine reductase component B subunit [Acetoanaerobium sticklandii]Q9EV94.1 RecName: Full=Glycine reductase complex component B subunits alpha and beta; AltName: Full=Selenoprotein PB alpha/beta; Contains: RecName: Full=Betaine reductase component B subunit beta; Contains: RecName: Full=Betaine reductase component B subunit alpha [Acetoanaerobium sticklandii DSM 519]CAC14299.1 grdE proprotein [[Clostridium] sticklandii DSM 519] [Acetoanaerobium sticklandii DSM 519]CBH21232.1